MRLEYLADDLAAEAIARQLPASPATVRKHLQNLYDKLGRWCALSTLLVPYGGLRAGDLRAGETLVINGATGGFGSAGVAVALALGAAKVVATGRNERALDELAGRFGPRVRPAPMTCAEEDDRRRPRAALPLADAQRHHRARQVHVPA
jgi:hypothetical protein